MYLELKDGILFARYQPGTVITDIETAEYTLQERIAEFSDADYPILIDLGNLKKISYEAMNHLGKPRASQYVSHCAMITRSRLEKVAISFYMRFNKPVVPIKTFLNYEDAIKWLKNFKP